MREIFVSHPYINGDTFRRYSYQKSDIRDNLFYDLKYYKVTPETHPRAVDLCSGDGSIASMLIDLGWQPDNITCVDLSISPTPVVQGVHWVYMDLNELSSALKQHEKLPQGVETYRRSYDVVTEWLGFLDYSELIHNFFARPGGYILNEGIVK